MKVESYLFLEGRCDEAIDFYRKALGAEVLMLMRYGESPEPQPPGMLPPGSEKKVMHCSLKIGESLLMMSDGECSGKANFSGFSLSLAVKNDAEADKTFSALSERGKVNVPLTKTFFSPRFGMLEDRFGVAWMVLVQK